MDAKHILAGVAGLLAAALTVEAVFIYGFNEGADTALCVQAAIIDGPDKPLTAPCRRVKAKSPFFKGLLSWRKLNGDEAKFEYAKDTSHD